MTGAGGGAGGGAGVYGQIRESGPTKCLFSDLKCFIIELFGALSALQFDERVGPVDVRLAALQRREQRAVAFDHRLEQARLDN